MCFEYSNIRFIETGFAGLFLFFSRAQMSRYSLGDHHMAKVLVSDEIKSQLSLLPVCYGESWFSIRRIFNLLVYSGAVFSVNLTEARIAGNLPLNLVSSDFNLIPKANTMQQLWYTGKFFFCSYDSAFLLGLQKFWWGKIFNSAIFLRYSCYSWANIWLCRRR